MCERRGDAIPAENLATDVAIVGMAGRWPGARTVAEFWRNIRDGVESISRFCGRGAGGRGRGRPRSGSRTTSGRRSVLDGRRTVRRRVLRHPARARPRLLDPQHRALPGVLPGRRSRTPGTTPRPTPGAIGVFAGCGLEHVLPANVCADRRFVEEFTGTYPLGAYPTMLGIDRRTRWRPAWPTSSTSAARASPSRRPARPRWSPSRQACQSLLELPVRHGARRRRLDHVPAEARLPLPGRRDGVGRRPLPAVRGRRPRGRCSATASASCC